MVLEAIGKKKCSCDLVHTGLSDKSWCALIAGVISECVHLQRLCSVEVFRIDLGCAVACEDDLYIFLLGTSRFENNHFLVLLERRVLRSVSHDVICDDLARELGCLGMTGDP